MLGTYCEPKLRCVVKKGGTKKLITVAEVEQQYPDEWVLLEIVRDHKQHLKVVGRLIAHSPEREGLLEPHKQYRAEHPNADLFTWFTGELVADKDVVIVF